MLVTAPIRRPPALPPRMTRRSAAVHPSAMSFSAQEMKSLNVFILFINRPCSYQGRPISPPPRTCAMAKTNPRSSRFSRVCEKAGSMVIS